MERKWRTIRVFISSTFRDMHAERDHLIKVVFPELRERLGKHRFHLVDIDLRWGVTAEQAENDQVLDLCLEEIDRCRPFFVGILGQRYGWVPEQLPDPAVRRYGWIQEMTGKSITELEVLHGVLRNSAMKQHALFYLRRDDYLQDVPPRVRDAIYTDEHGDKLRDSRGAIECYCKSHHAPLREYPCAWNPTEPDLQNEITGRIVGLEQFGEWVKEDLWDAISLEHPEILEAPDSPALPGTEDWLAEEQHYHEYFIESRLRVYVGRQRIHEQLIDYLNSDSTHPLLLSGASGSGKSAILGKLWVDWQARHLGEFVLPHFVGASPSSTNHHAMLRRFCLQLRNRFEARNRFLQYHALRNFQW